MTRGAIYCRVSTDEQVEGYSLEAQLRACRALCADRGWQIAIEYVEEGRSARTDDPRKRPEFARMMASAERRQCDVIVVHKLDRFSRNLRVTLDCFEKLGRAGVGFVSLSEPIDHSSPNGRLHLTIMGGVAEWYSDNLSCDDFLDQLPDEPGAISHTC